MLIVFAACHYSAHSIIRTHKGGSSGYKELFDNLYVSWGVAGLVAMVFLCFFSLRWFRQKSYEVS
jgi:DMSO/TMAO reductase YedYZ heme-binding membrane subunit